VTSFSDWLSDKHSVVVYITRGLEAKLTPAQIGHSYPFSSTSFHLIYLRKPHLELSISNSLDQRNQHHVSSPSLALGSGRPDRVPFSMKLYKLRDPRVETSMIRPAQKHNANRAHTHTLGWVLVIVGHSPEATS
jgi:hypothetical protein